MERVLNTVRAQFPLLWRVVDAVYLRRYSIKGAADYLGIKEHIIRQECQSVEAMVSYGLASQLVAA